MDEQNSSLIMVERGKKETVGLEGLREEIFRGVRKREFTGEEKLDYSASFWGR